MKESPTGVVLEGVPHIIQEARKGFREKSAGVRRIEVSEDVVRKGYEGGIGGLIW